MLSFGAFALLKFDLKYRKVPLTKHMLSLCDCTSDYKCVAGRIYGPMNGIFTRE